MSDAEPLTDEQRDAAIRWCDRGVAGAEAAIAEWIVKDPVLAARWRVESVALRMVALKLRSEQVTASAS